jgi:hypothetical protein
MRWAVVMLCATLLGAGCGARQASDGESDVDVGEPDWSPCVVKGEFETCAEVCAAQAMQCVAAGCPAEPESCKPDSCDMATSVLGLGDAICTDALVGSTVAGACDDPIEFIFNDHARCCCED